MPRANISDSPRPNLILEQFFAGTVSGWGMTLSRSGTVQNQFSIEAEGEWNANSRRLQLRELYRFDDGHVDDLRWTITRENEGRYTGSEPKLVGSAEGQQNGNHFHWSYQRKTPMKGNRTVRLGYSDHFVLMKPTLLLATALVTRFGFMMASLSVVYEKKS
jgi:Protein of unknown function (DUF3833)